MSRAATSRTGRTEKNSDNRLIELYPRHAGGRARRGREHAGGLPARPGGFFRRSRRAGRQRRQRRQRRHPRAISARLGGRGFAAASVARRLSAIRQLYRFLYAEGHRKDDPAAVIEGPKRGRALPKVLVGRQVDQLLGAAREAIDEPTQPLGERLRAARLNCLLEVLYATGLRVSELVALPASAARRDQRMLIVRGKGGKERLVPLNDAAKRAMTRLSRVARGGRTQRQQSEMAVPVVRRERPSQPPAFRARPQSACGGRRPRGRAGQPACAAPRLRQPPAAERRRSARRCRRCSAMPISRRRRSTPMCWRSG